MRQSQAALTLSPIKSWSSWSSEDDHPGTLHQAEGVAVDAAVIYNSVSTGAGVAGSGESWVDDTLSPNVSEAALSAKLPIITPTIFSSRSESFRVLKKWEGKVLSVGTGCFVARLVDLTDVEPAEEAEFTMDEVSDEDVGLISPGAIFYWSIGMRVTLSGQRLNQSMIRFRRLPAWTERELAAARKKATAIMDEIGWRTDG